MNVSADKHQFSSVKAYAKFLLDNYLHELTEENLHLARAHNLPLLTFFSHLSYTELYTLSKDSLQAFFEQILADEALTKTYQAIEQWKENKLPGIPQDEIKAADIVLSYKLHKKLFIKFITAYTQEAHLIIQIIQELEDFYIKAEQLAFNTFIEIQRNELLTVNEELRAQQEELQTLNEELRESQEQYAAVNAELVEQIHLKNKIEAALRNSEARFRLLAENSLDIISTHTPEGIFTYISPACETLLGYTPEELIGRTPYEIIHPDDILAARNVHESLAVLSHSKRAVYRKIAKDGSYKWFESVCHMVSDTTTHQIIEIQIASRDITQRKEIEAHLEKEREYLRAVLEHITDGIVACDENGILSFFNKASREFHGLPEKAIQADQWATHYDLYYADGKTLLKQEDMPLLRALSGEEVSAMEVVIAPAHGKKRIILTNGTRVAAANGRTLGAVAIMRDITDSKEAHDKLIKSQAMLAESQAIAHVGSWEWNIEADRVMWSDELKRIYGYPPEIEGLTYEGFLKHIYPEDKEFTHQIISSTFQTHQPYTFQHRIISTSGEIRWIQARGKALLSPEGKVIQMTGTGQDITELKKAEEELSDKNQELTQALEELRKAEEYLVKMNNELELKVQERTQELRANEEQLRQTLDQSIEINKRLQESENFLSSIIDQSPVSTWIADANGTQIRVNEACMRLFGVSDTSLSIGKYNILKDETLIDQPYYKDIVAVFTEGKIAKVNSEYNLSKVKHVDIPTGKPISLVVTIFPIKNAKGTLTHAVVQHEDVTQQKVAEQALRVSEERYRFMANSIPHLVWTALPTGIIDYYNSRWEEFTGLSAAQLTTDGWEKAIYPEDLPYVGSCWNKCLNSGNEFTVKYRMLEKHGTYRWMWTNAVPFKDEHSQIIKWFGTTTDIHEQQLALDALTEAQKQFQFLAEFIPQIVWRTLDNGDHDYFNRQWYNYTGITYEESMNSGWAMVLHPDDFQRTKEIWKYSLETGESYQIEYRFRRYDGVYRWFLGRALPMRNTEGKILKWFGTCTDIHDQKEALENLEQSQKELRAKNEELKRINIDLDNFIYTASHDLKAPISNLEGLTSMLERKVASKIDDAEKKVIQMMHISVAKLKRTIADLTQITKVQKELNDETEPLLLKEVLKDVKADIAALINETNAQIHTDFQVPYIRFARKNIRSILYNLLTNAVKYHSPDRIPEIHIRSVQQNSYIVLSFSDNGLGIRSDQIEKIFLMFKRAHTHVEGSGIGLYIVKRIIENSGGKIEVASELGKGTTFTLYFKLL